MKPIVPANRDVPAYTDPVITPRVTPIRLVHMTELRKAVVALEGGSMGWRPAATSLR